MMRDHADLVGSLSGAGGVQLGAATLTIGSPAAQKVASVFSGVISGTGGLVKTSDRLLTLSGNNTFTGQTLVKNGTLLVNGQAASALIRVEGAASTLGGIGSAQMVWISEGTLSPGTSPGIFTVTDVDLTTAALKIELNGAIPGSGYDRLVAHGAVTLGGPVQLHLGFVPEPGATFRIIDKTSSGAITGVFEGLPEAASFSVEGTLFRITYGGSSGGNDVVLTVLESDSEIPPLFIQRSGPGIVISWSAASPGFFLEQTDSLGASSWSLSPPGNPLFIAPQPIQQRFYRLRRQ